MTGAIRTPLPRRRPCVTEPLVVATRDGREPMRFEATVGFDPVTGAAREIFLSGAKDGSMLAAILDDASVVISVALQHGVPVAALAKSVWRGPEGSVVGAAIALVERLDAEVKGAAP
jgi:hypothetical protein